MDGQSSLLTRIDRIEIKISDKRKGEKEIRTLDVDTTLVRTIYNL